ncbi:hypothetical protein EDB19DRAFT_2025492 [Suillus lakei]|nr:hypothetical protein EDB19DRAFT_2025492 [Suillus lakei]
MLRNFIKNIVNSSLSSAEMLRDRKKARSDSRGHGDLHSRLSRRSVLLVSPAPLPTTPLLSHHLSDTDTPLSSIIEMENAVCRVQMATLEGIPDEMQCYILGFLSYNEIIRCASTCRTMYNTVKYSVELQYIIELGAHGLIEAHPRGPTVSIPDCLDILRKKADAWSTFKPNASKSSRFPTLFGCNSIIHQNIVLRAPTIHIDAASKAADIKAYSTTIAHLHIDRANPALHTFRYMDEPHDLEVVITLPIDPDTLGFKYRIDCRTISTGEGHPLSHGSRVVHGRAAFSEVQEIKIAVAILKDRLAIHLSGEDEDWNPCWSLQVLNWQRRSPADDLCAIGDGELLDVRFLTREKLLALSSDGHVELYHIEDLSQAPQLHARFLLPIYGTEGAFDHPSTFHSAASCARLALPEDDWIWTTNPADRVISVEWHFPSLVFIISARVFFMDIPPTWFDPTSKDGRSVPWSSWGPQNSRFFPEERLHEGGLRMFGVGGSRVVWASHVAGQDDLSFQLYMMDFNPSAVARGIGKVITQPTTSVCSLPDMPVTTYLPFVEVSDDKFYHGDLLELVLDEEQLAILTFPTIRSPTISPNILGVENAGRGL